MLKELVEYLFERGQESVESRVVPFPNDPDQSLVIGPEGVKPLATVRQQPLRVEACHSVEDFAACLEQRAADLAKEVWYDENQAIAYTDDLLRRSSVSIPFSPHPVLTTVKELATRYCEVTVELRGCTSILDREESLN